MTEKTYHRLMIGDRLTVNTMFMPPGQRYYYNGNIGKGKREKVFVKAYDLEDPVETYYRLAEFLRMFDTYKRPPYEGKSLIEFKFL